MGKEEELNRNQIKSSKIKKRKKEIKIQVKSGKKGEKGTLCRTDLRTDKKFNIAESNQIKSNQIKSNQIKSNPKKNDRTPSKKTHRELGSQVTC